MPVLDLTHLPPGRPLLVACSGGADSVALLHLLREQAERQGWGLTVAHLDHGLRTESADDAAFVAQLCARLEVPCLIHRVDLPALRRPGEGLEGAARRVRYEWLLSRRARLGAGALVVTGHTADDQAETVALRWQRGAGWRGLRGILPHRPDGVVRPLLGVRGRALRAWCRAHDLPWREDVTNRDRRLRRNRWRGRFEALPEGRRDRLVAEAAALAEGARRLHGAGRGLARWWLGSGAPGTRGADPGGRELAGVLLPGEIALERPGEGTHYSVLASAILEEGLEQAGVRPDGVGPRLRRPLLAALACDQGTKRRPGLWQIGPAWWAETLSRGLLLAPAAYPGWPQGSDEETGRVVEQRWRLPCSQAPDEITCELPAGGRLRARLLTAVEIEAVAEGRLPAGVDGRWCVILDAGAAGGTVTVRYPRPGDRLRPFGAPGRRRVKELLREQRVPRLRRNRLPVLEGNGRLLWLVGVRLAEEGRVTSATGQGVILSFTSGGHRDSRTRNPAAAPVVGRTAAGTHR